MSTNRNVYSLANPKENASQSPLVPLTLHHNGRACRDTMECALHLPQSNPIMRTESCPRTPAGHLATISYLEQLITASPTVHRAIASPLEIMRTESCPQTPAGHLATISYLERLATTSQINHLTTISPYRTEAWKHLTII